MILLYLLPAIGWGLMPVFAVYSKARPSEQLLGTTIMALFFSIITMFIVKPILNKEIFIICFISGIFWTIGQYLQFSSFKSLPVSEAMPISNGTQLIFTTLTGAIIFREFKNTLNLSIAFFAILLIIFGIIFTSYQDKQNENIPLAKKRKNAIIYLLISSLSLTIYVTIPRFYNISGFSVILPQAIGMFLSSIIIILAKKESPLFNKVTINLLTGLLWSIANLSIFIIIPILGVSLGFTLFN